MNLISEDNLYNLNQVGEVNHDTTIEFSHRKRKWGKELGRKKKYYVQEFNPTCDLQQKEYICTSIMWRAKIL